MPAIKSEQLFEGARLRYLSERPFEQVLSVLLEDIGETPVKLDELVERFPRWDDYKEQVQRLAGPSGFMLFGLINHGAWISKVGTDRRAMRVILGNPAIAVTMLRHDLSAGLFAPVEVLLLEEEDGDTSLIYLKPSSLMVFEPNEALLQAASALDQKLEALVAKVAA